MPFFSVIIPLYNHRTYIEPALRSLLAQSVTDWEAVVVDDGSTDGSGLLAQQVARESDGRINVIGQPNGGPAVARNHAIAHARGQWLAFLDSDDLWTPDALAGHLSVITAQPAARLTFGRYRRLLADGSMRQADSGAPAHPSGARDLFLRMFLNPSCTCMQRTLFGEVGPFRDDLPPVEDYHLFLHAGLRTKFYPTGHAPALRRRHDSNISRGNGRNQALGARMLEEFYRAHGQAAGIAPDEAAARLARAHYRAGRTFFHLRQFRDARRELAMANQWRWGVRAALLGLASRMRGG